MSEDCLARDVPLPEIRFVRSIFSKETKMKRSLLGMAAVMALLVVGVAPASAEKRHGHSHHNHHSHGDHDHDRHRSHGHHHHYSRARTSHYGGGYSPGSGFSFYFGSRPSPRWHDTSHYDYYPGYYQRHGNHYDYIPGHYHYHRSGHWHH